MKSLASHKIREWKRAQKGRVMKDIAVELGVTDSAVSFWVNGDRVPHGKHMAALQAMGVCEPNDWFLPAPENSQNSANSNSGRTDSAASLSVPSTAKAA